MKRKSFSGPLLRCRKTPPLFFPPFSQFSPSLLLCSFLLLLLSLADGRDVHSRS